MKHKIIFEITEREMYDFIAIVANQSIIWSANLFDRCSFASEIKSQSIWQATWC